MEKVLGSRGGAVVRALASHQFGSGSNPGPGVISGSRPCSEGLSPGFPGFLPPQKSTFLNSNSTNREFKGHGFVSVKTVMCYPRQTKVI